MDQAQIFDAITRILSLLVTAGSVGAAIYFGSHTKARSDEKEAQDERAQVIAETKEGSQNTAVILTKLEMMQGTLFEIKTDNKTMREDIGMLRDRMAKVEASTASAHKRIDTIQNNKGE